MNTWKGVVLHRTVPRHRENGEPIRTYADRFHTEPFQSSRITAALKTKVTDLMVKKIPVATSCYTFTRDGSNLITRSLQRIAESWQTVNDYK